MQKQWFHLWPRQLFGKALCTFRQARLYLLGLSVLLSVTSLGAVLYTRLNTPTHVSAATSSTINFQARLLSNTGALVPDGTYNVEFKLYDASSSAGSSQGSCAGDTNCLWTETRTGGNQVTVKNGYFSVYLGSVTSFPSINWDQELWLTLNIGGTGSPSWDGEMTPRTKLTAVPYAFKAGSAANVTSNNTNAASTNSNNVSISTGNASGATSNSGNLTVDTGTATGTAGTISIGTANTSGITIGRSGVTTLLQGNVSIAGGTNYGVYYRDNSGNVVTTAAGSSGECFRATTGAAPSWGSCSGTGDIIQNGNNFGTAVVIGSNDTYNLAFETDGTTRWYIDTSGHFLPSVNDTYDIGSDSLRVRDIYAGPGTIHIGTSTSDEGTLSYNTTTNNLTFNATNGFIFNPADVANAFQILDTASRRILGVDTNTGSVNIGPSGGLPDDATLYLYSGTGGGDDAAIRFNEGYGSNAIGNFNGSSNLEIKTNNNTVVTLQNSNGAASFRNSTNSQTAFQIQNSSGTSLFNLNNLTSGLNLIANSSFESNINGWTAKGTPTGSTPLFDNTASNAQFGSATLRLASDGTTDGAQYSYPFAPSTQYSASFWAKTSSGSNDFIIGRQENGSDVETGCSAVTVTTTWTQFSCTFTTGGTINSTSNLYFRQQAAGSPTIYIDGVTLVTGATALTYIAPANNLQVDANYSNLTLNNTNTGEIQPWQLNVNGLPATLGDSSSVVANGFVYVIGGNTGTNQNTVYYAKLNSDGSTGAWQANANTLPAVRSGHSSVVANGYVYVIGGTNGSTTQSTVYYAKLNADGSTGAWQTSTNALPGPRNGITAGVANGHVYVIGGFNGSVSQTTVFYAKLNADGSIGSWQSDSDVLPAERSHYGFSISNGYVYITGGRDAATNPQSNVYYSRLNSDGSIGAWTTSSITLTGNRRSHTTPVINGYMYAIGGLPDNTTANTLSIVQYAKLNSDGSIGNWSTSSNSLPQARRIHSTVASNGYVYVLGGNNASNNFVSTVYYTSTSRILAGGSLDLVGLGGQALGDVGGLGGELTAGNTNVIGTLSVRGPADFTQGVSVGGNLTVNGTTALQSSTNDAKAFSINNAAGTQILGVNTLTSGLNLVTNPSFESNTNGWSLRNAGGSPTIAYDDTASNAQFGRATLALVTSTTANNGVQYNYPFAPSTQYTLSFWAKRSASSSTSWEVGRADNGSDTSCTTNPAIGTVGITTTWTQFSCTFTTGGTIGSSSNFYIKQTDTTTDTIYIDGVTLVTGSTVLAYVAPANNIQVDANYSNLTLNSTNTGEIQPWQLNANALPASLRNSGTATASGYVYITGGTTGAGSANNTNTVYYAKANSDGSLGAWTTNANTLPIAMGFHNSVAANGYIYAIGGTNTAGTSLSTVYYAKLNADGSTGVWQTNSNSLPDTRRASTSVVANGYVYVINGRDNSNNYENTVLYAKLNADGSTGVWTTGGNNVPAGLQSISSVVANGYVYVFGGEDGSSAKTTVYYSKLNADGSVGVWSTNTANPLPAARDNTSATVVNGYVYVIGGSNDMGTTAQNTVFYAKANSDGSLGAWTSSSNTLPAVRERHQTVTVNGYIYVIAGTSGGTTTRPTVYYTSTSRVLVGGSLDLVGLGGQTLGDTGGAGTGGSLYAVDGSFLGSLSVQGQGIFAGSVSIGKTLTVNDTAYFSSTSTASDSVADTTSAGIIANFTQVDDNDGSDVNSAFRISVTSSSGDADTLYGLNVANITGGSATETGVFVGSGWDRAINTQNTSTTSVLFQSASAAETLLTVNSGTRSSGTAGNQLVVGNATGTDTALTLFVVDSATGDPTTNSGAISNGSIFYNSTTNKFRCYQNGGWVDCITASSGTPTLQSAYDGGNTIETLTSSVVITETTTGALTHDLLQLTVNQAASGTFAGDALQITMDGNDANAFTGNGLNIIVDQSQNTGNPILVQDDAATTLFQLNENGGITLGAASAETTAITITDTDYTNALSIGDNNITGTTYTLQGTTAAIDFTNFDVLGDGSFTFNNNSSTNSIIDLASTGDFIVRDSGTTDLFTVTDAGQVRVANGGTGASFVLVGGTGGNIGTQFSQPGNSPLLIGAAAGQNFTGIRVQNSGGAEGPTLTLRRGSTNGAQSTNLFETQNAAGNVTNFSIGPEGAVTFAPESTSDITMTLDNDSNFIQNATVTDTGNIQDINLTLGNDAGADTVSALNIDVTSAATGADGDILYGLNINNLTGADADVSEIALRIGSGWDNALDVNGTLISLTELQALDGGLSLDEVYDADSDKQLDVDDAAGLTFDLTTTGDFVIEDNGTAVLTVDDSGNTTIGASRSLRLTGGNTASRPGSPTEGMMYFDTDTDSLITYSNGKWQGDRTTASKIVAASNSSQTEKDSADFVGDGNTGSAGDGDQVQINAAIAALPAGGGTVFLLPGTYTVDASISVPSNVTLAGSGAASIITIPNSFNAGIDVIVNSDTSGGNTSITLRDFKIDGNRANQSSGTMVGISLENVGSGSGSSSVPGVVIDGLDVNSLRTTGILFDYTAGVRNSIITNSRVVNAGNGGINIGTNSTNIVISDNIIQGTNGYGIYVQQVTYATITGNTFEGNISGLGLYPANYSTVSGNVMASNGYGIECYSSVGTTIANNTVRSSTDIGIYLESCNNNNVSSNTIDNNGEEGIWVLDSDNNQISNNRLTNNTGSGSLSSISLITSGNSDGNRITDNTITDTAGTGYAINIADSTHDNTYLADNKFSGTGATSINDAGTDTIYAGQMTSATSGIRFRSANATDAFHIQNASGSSFLNIDTSGNIVSVCNSADCDTINIGTNADADTITLGDSTDTVGINGAVTILGATLINTTGTANTQIGNATGTFQLDSAAVDISTAGAISGVTTLSTSGIITVGALGTADTDTILCRNAANQIASCSSTFDASVDLDNAYDNDSDKHLSVDNASGLTFDLTTTGDLVVEDNGTAFATFSNTGGITLAPAGTSDLLINQAAGVQTNIVATAAPTVDMFTLSNSGQATTTDGVDGIFVDFYQGADAAADTNSAMRVNVTTTADDVNDNLNAFVFNLTNNSTNGTQRGVRVVNSEGTTNNQTEVLFDIENNETTADLVDYYFLITTASNDTNTDAIDVSDSGLWNAINVGDNNIAGTTAVINFTNFDLASTGAITVATGLNALDTNSAGTLGIGTTTQNALTIGRTGAATTINGAAGTIDFTEFDVSGTTGAITINDGGDAGNISIEGTVLDINSLDFVGAGLVTTGSNTSLTLTPGGTGDIVVSADSDTNLQVAGTVTSTTSQDIQLITLTNQTSSGTQRGLVVTNANDAANATTEALMVLDNAETTANLVTDYLLITSSATDTTTDAIDVSDADLFNAINVGANNITGTSYTIQGTTAAIDFTNFDVASTGDTDIAAHLALGTGGTISGVVGIHLNETYDSSDNCGFGCYGMQNYITLNNPSNPTLMVGYLANLSTSAASFTVTNAYGFWAQQGTLGAGSTITNNTGLFIENLTNGTNDYAIRLGGADTADIFFETDRTHILKVQDQDTAATAGSALQITGAAGNTTGTGGAITIQAGAGGNNGDGGAVTLQSGAAGGGNNDGGNLNLTAGAGTGAGSTGLVVINTPTLLTASTQNCTGTPCAITQANVDSYGAIVITTNATGYTVTLGDPTLGAAAAGRLIYITNADATDDFSLSANAGGEVINLKPNTTATMIWNGSDWTAAGASSSTDLQAAYDNTAATAGGAEIVLSSTGTGGLTVRNDTGTAIVGSLLEVQTAVGSNLFSVNNNATEYANNGGAESSTFTMWTGTPTGGTIARHTTAANVATGTASASVTTTATAGHGVENTLSTTLTNGLKYQVSFTIKSDSASAAFSTLDVMYSYDGTNLRHCVPGTPYYSTGTASQSTTTITGTGTTWTAAMVGKTFVFANGSSTVISGFTDADTLTAATSQTVSAQNYGIYDAGFSVKNSVWSRVSCFFTAPASGTTITASNSVMIRQTDATARVYYIDNLSVTVSADANHAVDGSVDDATNFSTFWTAFDGDGGGAGTASAARDTSVIYDSGASARVDTSNHANMGIRNNMSITPAASTQYLVSFYARSATGAINDLTVRYSEDGGTSFVSCTDYNTQAISTSTWTKITCLFTADSSVPGSPNPDLVFTQATAPGGSRSIYIDALSITLNNNNASNVQIGGGNKGGPITLLTLDRSANAPIAANNDAYLGSMYYDTTSGRIQCYEADGWGACGSAPDNIVNLNPEYAGAVLNGSGVGTMTADVCGNGGGLSVNTTFCSSGEARNYYQWTSPQASAQTYSIYVTYQLPATFKNFASDDTVQLTARRSSSNASVTYEMFKVENGAISACGTATTVTTSDNTWQTVGINGNESTSCSFTTNSASAFVIFKINVTAQSNANAYVGTLSFTTTGR